MEGGGRVSVGGGRRCREEENQQKKSGGTPHITAPRRLAAGGA